MKSLLALLVFCALQSSAQDQVNTDKDPYAGVKGHPYLVDEWMKGTIKFNSGRVLDQFKLKFDIARNVLLLQYQGSAFTAEAKVIAFTMYTKSKKGADSIVFRRGFPQFEENAADVFYHVLCDGNTKLLKYPKKVISEEKKLLAATNRSFEQQVSFYLFKDGVMVRISEDKPLLSALSDKSEELKKFVAEKELKLRSEEDYLLVVNRYNELKKN